MKLALAIAAGFAVGWYLARRYAPQSVNDPRTAPRPLYSPVNLLGIKV